VIELAQLVDDFAEAIQLADARGPQARNSRSGISYMPGMGPHSEAETLELVVTELSKRNLAYVPHSFGVPYPGATRQRCDWCLGSAPCWEWAIEAKMLRMFGDNGKLNDNMLMHILSPYAAHRSALTDCTKLAASALDARKALLIFGYDYDGWPMEPAIEAFEVLASRRVDLSQRHRATYDHLLHPVHQRGHVYAWEIANR
jgi:hypothetical protein